MKYFDNYVFIEYKIRFVFLRCMNHACSGKTRISGKQSMFSSFFYLHFIGTLYPD
jgi:hypothetical protein